MAWNRHAIAQRQHTEARLVDGVWRPKSDFHAAVVLGLARLGKGERARNAGTRQHAGAAGHSCTVQLVSGMGPYKLALCGELEACVQLASGMGL